MSWWDRAARWSLRVPRGALQAAQLRTRPPARRFADDSDQRQPGPSRERDVSPSKLRRDAIICPPVVQPSLPYRLPPHMPPPRRPPPSRPPRQPPRPTTRLDFVRTLRVPPGCKPPPPPRSKDDPPVITELCPRDECISCPMVPGPGKQEAQPEAKPEPTPCQPQPLPPPPPPEEPKDTCCLPPGEGDVKPQPLFSCEPPLDDQGPCPPTPPECPCPPPARPPPILRYLSHLFWWGGRAALAASIVYWTYVYGLWGSSDDTQAIADKWRKVIGLTKQQAGTGLWVRLTRLWDNSVKMVFSAVAMLLSAMMGPGRGTEASQPRHQTAEISKDVVEDEEDDEDDDDDLAPCGCCKRRPPESELAG